ncbi:hypothetical protein BH10PLA1_BH10PLA1_08790 [soil metagenome]
MRSFTTIALITTIGVGVVGCSTPTKPTTKPVFSNRTESSDATAELTPESRPGDESANMLAQKLAAYSKELAPRIKDRADRTKSATPATGSAAAKESQVVWLAGGGLSLSPNASTPPADPLVKPVMDTPSVSSNQVAVLSSSPARKSADVPQIVPEGEDLPSAATGQHETLPDTDQLMQQLSGKVKSNPRDVSAQLDFQLLQFLRGEQVPQMKTLGGLQSEDREVLTALLDGLSNFRSNVRNDGNQMLGQKIRPLVEMAERLRGQADLARPTAALCTRVDGYGVYDPIDPAHFSAGREHPVIVYCEVENFSSQLNDKKQWETRLSNEAVLYTETGMAAWTEKSKSVIDLSRNRRHDFFIINTTKLPSTLVIGRYILKISVTDQQSNRVAETTIPIQITAD